LFVSRHTGQVFLDIPGVAGLQDICGRFLAWPEIITSEYFQRKSERPGEKLWLKDNSSLLQAQNSIVTLQTIQSC